MKIRSRPLFEYLLKADVLNGTPEQIAHAKKVYRNQYKRNWKLRKRPVKEVRFTVTLKQFVALKTQAQAAAMPHTSYVRHVALSSIGQPMPETELLLSVLQNISMASIAIARNMPMAEISALIQRAENTILQYLKVES